MAEDCVKTIKQRKRSDTLKKLLILIFALFLAAAFYIYTIMKDGEMEKNKKAWLVKDEAQDISLSLEISSASAESLAKAFGAEIIVPAKIRTGKTESFSYFGTKALKLTIQGEGIMLFAVRPLAASSLLQEKNLRFLSSDMNVLGYKASIAGDNGKSYVFLSNDDSAFLVVFEGTDESVLIEKLSALSITRP